MWRTGLYLGLFLLSLALSCKPPPALSGRYTVLNEKPEVTPLSREVTLVADNQFHYLYGDQLLLRSEIIDHIKFTSTAIRPVQLELYARDILGWILARHEGAPVIHLGDALDLACEEELELFLEVMRGAKSWVMAPGNHDAYFYGVSHAESADWQKACQGGGRPVTKIVFLRRYLAALAAQEGEGNQALRGYLAVHPSILKGQWRYEGQGRPFLRAVAWELDEKQPWRSFLLQEVDLTAEGSPQPVRAILLDTVQYQDKPILVPTPSAPGGESQTSKKVLWKGTNAGVYGDLLDSQGGLVEEWLSGEGGVVVLVGHHPYDSLGRRGQRLIERVRKGPGMALYLSGHTHAGRYFVRGEEGDTWLELNIGSSLDWPPEYRTLQFLSRPGEERILMSTPLYRLYEAWRTQAQDAPRCESAWEAQPGEGDYYLAHLASLSGPAETQKHLMDSLLYTYKRLLAATPTRESALWPQGCQDDASVEAAILAALGAKVAVDKKRDLLRELGRFEAARSPQDPQRRRDFRLCQALWASRFDSVASRAPEPHDALILLPIR